MTIRSGIIIRMTLGTLLLSFVDNMIVLLPKDNMGCRVPSVVDAWRLALEFARSTTVKHKAASRNAFIKIRRLLKSGLSDYIQYLQ